MEQIRLGLLADIHGDLAGMQRALRFLAHTDQILCAGDVVDRGAGADAVVQLLRQHHALCVKGNHEHSIIRSQDRWRASDRAPRLAELGRIVSDATLAYIEALPATAQITVAGVRILIAHGTPWSDLKDVFPDSRQSVFDQLVERYGASTDLIILGHTHHPMQVRAGNLLIVNPGSVYGVTGRDSHSCAIISLPSCQIEFLDLHSGLPFAVPLITRQAG